MSKLDKFNKHALYAGGVPSTGQKIRYRAMVLKESMELALAQNENSESGMETLYTTLENCITEEIGIRKLPLYDITWLMLHIQRKAAGETKKVGMRCEHCGKINDAYVDLSTVYVQNIDWIRDEENSIIDNEVCKIKVKCPDASCKHLVEALTNVDVTEKDYFNALVEICARSIVSIYDDTDVVDASECSLQELVQYVEQLDEDTMKKFSEFFENIPKTVVDVHFNCETEGGCGKDNKVTISDLSSFF